MSPFLHRHVLLPLYECVLRRRKTFRYRRELERTQWLSRAELERLQIDSLRRLLAHAFANSPYYREEWVRRGLALGNLRALEDFRQWPLVTREDIRANRLRLQSQLPGVRLFAHSTGGSSGVPLHFDIDLDSADRRTAAWRRGYAWAGADLGTRQLYFWGVSLGKRPRWEQWKDRWNAWLYRRPLLNSFDFTEARVPWYLERLNRCRPDVIVAYTNPLYSFARSLRERQLKPFSPKAIIVGAEKIYSFQRQLIEEVFGAPVFETYGTREFLLIGGECDRREGLHLTAENLLVEVTDDEGNPTPEGEEGNVVITDLTNYGMPFIRYVNGDRAVAGWSTCSCGRGLPLLKRVVGRQLDVLQTPDGRRIPGEFFPHLIKDFPAVRRFQVIQEQPDRVEMRAVLGSAWSQGDQVLLEEEIRKVLGPAVHFGLVSVADIPLTAAGKHQVVVNRVRVPGNRVSQR